MRRAIFPLFVAALLCFGSTRLSAETPPGNNNGERKQAPADQKADAGKKPGSEDRRRSRQRKSFLPTSSKRLR